MARETSRRRPQAVLVAGVVVLVLSCSSDGGEADDPFAPLEAGEPAPDGFADAVAGATAGAGELSVEQQVLVGGQVLAESSGVIDVGAGTARLDLVVQGASGESRIEQILDGGRMSERRVDDGGAPATEVDASGGRPLQLPDVDAVDDATDVAGALREAVALAPLAEHVPADAPPDSTCWAGDAAGSRRLRLEVCVADDEVLRRLRWTTQSANGLVGLTTAIFTPSA